MNDHNLDDLIIDTIAPKNNKTKGLLTIFALLIVVLIVAIILTKTLLKSPENSELAFEENLSDMIAPELKLQETIEEVKIAKPKEEPSIATIIEEKIKAPVEIKETKTTQKITTPKVVEEKSIPAAIEEETVTITDQKVISKPEVKKPVQKQIIKPKIVDKPKVIVKNPAKKPAVKTVKKTAVSPKVSKKSKTTTSGTYYVQVGSFREDPSTRFLSVIKSSGFKYHVTKPDRTGYKKLLIGPYKTRAEVDKARDVIRDRIHKSAFVVQK